MLPSRRLMRPAADDDFVLAINHHICKISTEGLYFLIKKIFKSIYILMVLVYFPSGVCVDDIVKNETNYQFTSVIVTHFENDEGVCWTIRRTVCNV